MDYNKVNKVGVVIKELLIAFEVTNDEWKTIESELNKLYLKESELVTLPKKKDSIDKLIRQNDQQITITRL